MTPPNDDLTAARKSGYEVIATLEYLVRLMKETGVDKVLLERLEHFPQHYAYMLELFTREWKATDTDT